MIPSATHRVSMRFALIPACAWLILLAGCDSNTPSSPTASPAAVTNAASTNGVAAASRPAAAEEPHYHLDHAQVGLPVVKLWIGATELKSEVCTTLPQVATGLMHRRGIGPEESMLFVFGTGDRRSFYMKNVPFDIAAAYIDTDGMIREVVQLKRFEERPVPSVNDNIQFVLETAPDWFTRNGIGAGTLIRTESGSLREVLGARAVLR